MFLNKNKTVRDLQALFQKKLNKKKFYKTL